MKKYYSVIITITMALLMACLTGCPGNTGNTASGGVTGVDSATSESHSSERPEVEAYRPPAELISIDLDADDPSTNRIVFVFDEDGRVSQCYYKIGENDVFLSYTYDGSSI